MPVQEVLSLLGILLVMVLVLGGCYLVTRWAGTGRFLVRGSAPTGVSVLCELPEEEGAQWINASPSDGAAERKTPDFREILRRLREKK